MLLLVHHLIKQSPIVSYTWLFTQDLFQLTHIYFSLIVNQENCAYVHHARNRSWNPPVLSNQGDFFFLNETTGSLDGARTYD